MADLKGLKRICMSCGARFYDLNKKPIICPSCDVEFTGEIKVKARRGRLPVDDGIAGGQVEEDTAAEEAEDETEEVEAEAEVELVSLEEIETDDDDDDDDIAEDEDDIDIDEDDLVIEDDLEDLDDEIEDVEEEEEK